MADAVLTISSRNYSSWSLRGWLVCRMTPLDFDTEVLSGRDPSSRAELLHLTPSFLVPRLTHGDIRVWDTMAIASYLNETFPEAHLLPEERVARAWCRSVSGEMHSGFANLRAALPMNLKARHPGFKIWAGATSDIERISTIWRESLAKHGGPWLLGDKPTLADAMYAPVATRFVTYDVALPGDCAAYRDHVTAWPILAEWTEAARDEPDDIEELDMEF